MNSRKRVLVYTVSYFMLMACCPEQVEPATFFFDIESVAPLNFNHNTIEFINESNAEISASSYAIVFQTTAPSVRNARPQKLGGGIFRSPHCTTMIHPIFSLRDQIVSIRITAKEDFSQSYLAGMDLSELFRPIYIIKDNPFSTPPSIIDDIPGGVNFQHLNNHLILDHETVDYRNQKDASFYGLKLIERPSVPVLLQFKLELIFQSGRIISGLTNPVLLK